MVQTNIDVERKRFIRGWLAMPTVLRWAFVAKYEHKMSLSDMATMANASESDVAALIVQAMSRLGWPSTSTIRSFTG